MTAIYASYSKVLKQFAMGADNLESNEGKIVSKIRYVIDRYVIGVAGCDNPIIAIDTIVNQNDTLELAEELSDITRLVRNICEWTKNYSQAQVSKYEHDDSARTAFNNVLGMPTTLVIFDSQEFELYECGLGSIFPLESFNIADMQSTLLPQNKLLLFALARNRHANKKMVTLPTDFYVDVRDTFEKMVQLDKEALDRERAIGKEVDIPRLGDLGSYCFYENGSIKFIKNI